MGPSCPVDDTMTLHSSTLGSMHICVSWLSDTSVQLVTAPATYRPFSGSSFTTRSSAAVALNSLMLGACMARVVRQFLSSGSDQQTAVPIMQFVCIL
jgi:hypothetical protein